MEKIISKNGKIYVIYGGQKFRKDGELARGGASWRCVKPACRGRMKIGEDDKVLSSTEHNHAPEPEVKKARQIATPAGKWMLVEPLSRTDEISYTPYLNRNKSKDAAVQTEPKDFSWNSPSPPAEKPDAWKHPALKDVPVRITNVKRRRLNKEYNWSRY